MTLIKCDIILTSKTSKKIKIIKRSVIFLFKIKIRDKKQ